MSITHTAPFTMPALAWTLLPDWGTIRVTGEDKKSYLQGQITCDVVKLSTDQSTFGAHCDAKGKVWSIFRFFHHQQGFALWQHASGLQTALTEIKKYAVFSKVEITECADISVGIMGPEADSFIDSITGARGAVRPCATGSAVKIDDNRWLLLIPESDLESIQTSLAQAAQLTPEEWDYFDVVQALPRITQADQNQHIPQTLNLQALGGINFEKGCYTGQETVARAKYRGTNKRVMRLIQGQANAEGPFTFERQVGENWRGAGTAIAQYRHSETGQALALIILNKDIEQSTAFRLTGEPESVWKLLPLPYSLDDE